MDNNVRRQAQRVTSRTPRFRHAVFLLLVGACLPLSTVSAQEEAQQKAAEYNTAGVQHYNAREWTDAIACFELADELAPQNPIIRQNLCNSYHAYANALAKENKLADATEQLLLAVSVAPENPLPLVQLGAFYLRMQMVDEAIYRLEEAIDLDPENLDAHDLLGHAYYDDNDLASALAQWEYVREIQPGRPGLAEKLRKAYREEAVEYKHKKTQSRHFQISYERKTTSGDLGVVLMECERAYREIGRKFGNVFPPTPIQVIVYTADDFKKATLLGEHVGGLYDGKIRVPVNDLAGNSLSREELRRRLFHEYTHVVVRFWVQDKAPWWLNEGLAETFSRGELTSRETDMLRQANRAGALFAIADLEESQLVKLDEETLRFAYIQAHALTHYMYRKFGLPCLTRLFEALAEGVPAEEAVRQIYRRDYAMLEKEVMASIGRVSAR
jgi:tetratricopeptide (TPR) repeat protein